MIAATATFALNAGLWFRRGRLVMVISSLAASCCRCAENPLIPAVQFPRTTSLIIPENISIIPLPAKYPELNPVENIWQFMRDNWLFNRIFGSYNEIVDHCCDAWNKLIDQPCRIMSIGRRQWTHEC